MNREEWLLVTQFILLHTEGKMVQGQELVNKAEELFGWLPSRSVKKDD
ncbi:hypothetical protein [Marininema halotolerans]|uniref:Uncharacterized protein n=1 Tax=Marininema halotolerans TaxID=1155944 RepID=A0A1I6SSU5_9BACL|nr:hypothetical protein [Marininema halotolerans]SFS80000.1 hypothetical protein SAMN05444972_10815 [Marininema halotolerans]